MLPGAPADVGLASSVPRMSPMSDRCPVRTASNHQPAEIAAGVCRRGPAARPWVATGVPRGRPPAPRVGRRHALSRVAIASHRLRFIGGVARVVMSGRLRHFGHPGALCPMRNRERVTGHHGHVSHRLVASTYELIALLDALSDRPSVVTALEETRQQVGLPPEVAGYLMPDITTETLANLSGQIESMLADEKYEAAVGLARAAVEVLQHVASRTPPHDPDLVDLSRQLDRIRENLDRVSGTR